MLLHFLLFPVSALLVSVSYLLTTKAQQQYDSIGTRLRVWI